MEFRKDLESGLMTSPAGGAAGQPGEGENKNAVVPYTGKYATNNSVRILYGYDWSDKVGAADIDMVIVSQNEFGGNEFLGSASKVNNTIYQYTYQYFFLFFAYSVGILAAIFFGIFTAAFRFFVVFFIKPSMRLVYLMAQVLVFVSQIWADVVRPIMALIFPWNKN